MQPLNKTIKESIIGASLTITTAVGEWEDMIDRILILVDQQQQTIFDLTQDKIRLVAEIEKLKKP